MPPAPRLGRIAHYATVLASRLRHRAGASHGVGYVGYLNGENLGDDLMPDALRSLIPRLQLMPLESGRAEQQLSRLKLSGPAVMSSALLGGGTLINPDCYRLAQISAALELGLPTWCLGTGVGSCGFSMDHSTQFEEWLPLLRRFQCLGVRGPLSQRALERAGLPGVEIVGDLALALTRDMLQEPADPPRFAVNLALPDPGDYGHGEYAGLIELETVIRGRVSEGWQPVLVAMHPGDVNCLELLRMAAGISEVSIHRPRTAAALMDLLAPCRFTVGVRLHAAVLSCCVGVPPLLLGYREKCLDFAQSMNLEAWHLSISSLRQGELTSRANELAQISNSLRAPLHAAALNWRARLANFAVRAARRGLLE